MPSPESSRSARVVAQLPLLLPVLVTSLALAAMACLLLEVYSLKTVLPTAAVLAVVGVKVVGLGERIVTRRDLLVDLLALGLALGFAVVNAHYSSQDVVIARDPGVYTVASQWLVTHDDLDIDGQQRLFGDSRAIFARSSGIGPTDDPGHLYAQGAHVVPAVLGVSGRVFGTSVMYKTNALLGGLALLAVYGFARRITGRWGALVVSGVLGVGLPQLAFSRDNYTEPLSQLFVYGGLALLWEARRGQWGRWAVAGAALAAGCLARIDALAVLPALAVYAGLRLAESPKGERRVVGRDVGAFALAAAVPAVLGWVDLKVLAPGYYHKLSPQYHKIVLLLVVAVVASAVLVAVAWAGADRWWGRVQGRLLPVLGNLAAAVVVLAGLALASRPLWQTVHGDDNPGTNRYVAALQAQSGEALDGNRRYYEHSVQWLGWYLGPLCVLLALVGLALLARRAVRDLLLVPFVLALVITAGKYLWNPDIVPDQIWVMRRFVPVVLPGIAVCGVLAGVLLVRRLPERVRPVAAGVGALALVLPVLHVSQPLMRVREYVPQLLETQRICRALPADAAVLVVGEVAAQYPMTVRTFCDVPTVQAQVHTAALARPMVAELAKSGRELYVMADEDVVTSVQKAAFTAFPTPVSTVVVTLWRSTLVSPPEVSDNRLRKLFVGKVGLSGYVESWLPAQ